MRNRISVAVFSYFLFIASVFGFAPNAKAEDANAVVAIEFVTDLSGSMKSNALVEPTRTFLKEFMKELYPGDRVILSTFGDSAVVGRPSNISTSNRDIDVAQLTSEIDAYVFSQSHTYTSRALTDACTALNKQRGPKVLVLLTDGQEEIPDGSPPLWDDLPKLCSGIAVHVIALTSASKPTVQQVGDRLKATVHDATKQSLTEIGNEIRAGIRIFVVTDAKEFALGNLQVGTAGEIRAAFTVSGASNDIELKSIGESFPDGVTLNCQNFKAPGDLRCDLLVTDALAPGSYTGIIRFEPTANNLAVVSPRLQVSFSRGQLHVQVEKNVWFGALKPGQTKSVSVAFTSNGPATPRPINVQLSGFPDGLVQFSPSQIMVPTDNVELTLTFVGGAVGDYSGQLSFQPTDATVVVEPSVITVGFRRQSWFGENWWWVIPVALMILAIVLAARHRFIVVPRRREANKARLEGRLVRPDQSEVKLDPKLIEQTIENLTFTATGTRDRTTISVHSNVPLRVRLPDGQERHTAPNRPTKIVDRTEILASDGTVIGTFRALRLRK